MDFFGILSFIVCPETVTLNPPVANVPQSIVKEVSHYVPSFTHLFFM